MKEELQSFIGKSGEFTTYDGDVCQCVVTGISADPFESDPAHLLVIDYVHPVWGRKVTGAMIGVSDFHPDNLNPITRTA